jgi:hypothetical protein
MIAVALLACVVAVPASVAAQGISGHVVNSYGDPLAGATVSVLGVATVRTDSTGAYRLTSLPQGRLVAHTTMIGYKPSLKMIVLDSGLTLNVDFILERNVQQLPTVSVREDSSADLLHDPSGFDDRRRKGSGGYIVTAADIEHRHTMDVEHLFYGIPAVQVDTGGIIVIKRGENSLRDIYMANASSYARCVGAQVFVDGIAMPQPFDVNTLDVRNIRGIEVYAGPATTPVTLRSPKTACGTVVIWTKL